jgi:hypothetical protein
VLANVKVWTVFWGQRQQSNSINQFYTDITSSPYFDWLTEYSTPTQPDRAAARRFDHRLEPPELVRQRRPDQAESPSSSTRASCLRGW